MYKPVFIFIDLLNDFFQEKPLLEIQYSLESNINTLTSFARKSGFPVIWVRQEFKSDLSDAFLSMQETGRRVTIKGTPGCKIISGLQREATDHEIIKKRYSAFFQTNLEVLLSKLSPSHIVIGGINTHACVRMTAVDAYQRDYRVIFAEDCISSYDMEFHRVSMRYLEQSIGSVMNNRDIISKFNPESNS